MLDEVAGSGWDVPRFRGFFKVGSARKVRKHSPRDASLASSLFSTYLWRPATGQVRAKSCSYSRELQRTLILDILHVDDITGAPELRSHWGEAERRDR